MTGREGHSDGLAAAIEALHKPEPVYWHADDCPVPEQHAASHVVARYDNDDICIACPPLRETCTTCVEYGEHGPEAMTYPCPTIRALAARPPADEGQGTRGEAEVPTGRPCSQCGERDSAMVKIGTTDGWCTTCLDEAAWCEVCAARAVGPDAAVREAVEAERERIAAALEEASTKWPLTGARAARIARGGGQGQDGGADS